MTDCFIALGSNLESPQDQVESGLRALSALPGCTLLSRSPWYTSRALGPGSQPDYVNGVARLETRLAPMELLRSLQAIETAHGRKRAERWAARTLDLDLLLYGLEIVDEPGLTIPHPEIKQRNFVIYPLFDLAPDLILPCGTPVRSLWASCPATGLQLIGESCDTGP